jgi:hypothetical protein
MMLRRFAMMHGRMLMMVGGIAMMTGGVVAFMHGMLLTLVIVAEVQSRPDFGILKNLP